MAEWQVNLAVSGPITVEREVKFKAEKGYVNPFWSDISIRKSAHGVVILVVARAENQIDANDAALYFVGQALDYLCLQINLPLYVSLSGTQFRPVTDNVKRIVRLHEWVNCFQKGRDIGVLRPTYARALSWYRKGRNSEDPIDAFLSYWSAIEGIGAKFAHDTPRTRRGAVNQICDCFDQLWQNTNTWKVIPNSAATINIFHKHRNGIAHGFLSIDVDTVKRVSHETQTLSHLAYQFLKDWDTDGVTPEPRHNG